MNVRAAGRASCALAVLALAVGPGAAEARQQGASGEWRFWGGDAGSTRYSSLDAIGPANAGDLTVAWRWKSANFGPTPENYYRATPIYANGRLYTVAGERRAAVAIDPATGETLWVYRLDEGLRWEKAPRRFSGRGLSYWADGDDERILLITPGYHMVALDAKTGLPIPSFGKNGIVDLHEGLGYEIVPWAGDPGPIQYNGDDGPWRARPGDPKADGSVGIDPAEGMIGNSSPGIVVGDVYVVGNSAVQGYYPKRLRNIQGTIRGFDIRTGRQLWLFHQIPQEGQFGIETWHDDSWKTAGKVDAWAPYSADIERGIVYIPSGPPHNDWYGGHRPGDNLFSESVIALDVKTGERIWHYQVLHHDIWDYDLPTAPNLVDITVDGRRIPAIVQTSKQGFAYVFDRTNGEPVWPIEEKPVPKSDTPGEWTSPTQPFPSKPAPYTMQGVSEDDLIDYTPELRARALELLERCRTGPLYTPAVARNSPTDGKSCGWQAPGANGGVNIMGGAAVDPETGILYVASQDGATCITLESDPERSEMQYVSTGAGCGSPSNLQGLSIFKPPYGSITAIDLKTGEHVFRIANGDTPDNIKEHPLLEGIDLPPTGKRAHANVLVTKTLLFYGEGRGGAPLFHAVDKRTGKEIASIELPASTNASPITFMHEGRQYIVVAVAGADVPGELVALVVE